jgi:hypothetical protein
MEDREVFISYAEEDGPLARALADELRALGYSTWAYENDGVPGLRYLAQVHAAIAACRVVLLIASPISITSHEIVREIEQAHKRQKPILPIRAAITHQQFAAADPSIEMACGTAVSLSADGKTARELALRLQTSLDRLSGRSRLSPSESSPPPSDAIDSEVAAQRETESSPAAVEGEQTEREDASQSDTPPMIRRRLVQRRASEERAIAALREALDSPMSESDEVAWLERLDDVARHHWIRGSESDAVFLLRRDAIKRAEKSQTLPLIKAANLWRLAEIGKFAFVDIALGLHRPNHDPNTRHQIATLMGFLQSALRRLEKCASGSSEAYERAAVLLRERLDNSEPFVVLGYVNAAIVEALDSSGPEAGFAKLESAGGIVEAAGAAIGLSVAIQVSSAFRWINDRFSRRHVGDDLRPAKRLAQVLAGWPAVLDRGNLDERLGAADFCIELGALHLIIGQLEEAERYFRRVWSPSNPPIADRDRQVKAALGLATTLGRAEQYRQAYTVLDTLQSTVDTDDELESRIQDSRDDVSFREWIGKDDT